MPNYVSDILARQAVVDIHDNLPKAYENGQDMAVREIMLNASMVAGLAFTNVSLGIVHSMAHTVGSLFHVSHGLADAIILPYIIRFNSGDARADGIYKKMAAAFGSQDMAQVVYQLNQKLHIPATLKEVIPDQAAYDAHLEQMAQMALADGCTKTNPIIPTIPQLVELFKLVYQGGEA